MKIAVIGGGQPSFPEVLASKIMTSQSANISLAPPNMEQLSGMILGNPQKGPQEPVRQHFGHQRVQGYRNSRRASEPALRSEWRRKR